MFEFRLDLLKIRFIASLAIMAFIGFFSICAHADTNERKTISIVTENYPPYEMVKPIDGLRGFDFDLATHIFKQLGYQPDIAFYPWKRALQEARFGKTVGILTCAYVKEREDFIIFSGPISHFTNGFYTRKDFKTITPKFIEDVYGQKVASITGYESLKKLQDLGMAPLAAPTTSAALRMLHAERFDYLFVNKQSTDFEIKLAGLSGEFNFHPIYKKSFHFCFSKKYSGVQEIVEQFNKALLISRTDGSFNKIRASYK